MSDRTIADRITERRVVEASAALALECVVDVVTQAVVAVEDALFAAQSRRALSLWPKMNSIAVQ